MSDPMIHDASRLLPHRDRMLFIDRLTDITPDSARAEGEIRPDNPFLSNDCLEMPALVEYAAQTIAAFIGHDLASGGGAIRGGLLVGLDSIHFNPCNLPPGTTLQVTIHQTGTVGGFGSYEIMVFSGSQCICSGTVKVMSAPETRQ